MTQTKAEQYATQEVHVSTLDNHLSLLPEKDRPFATDLVIAFDKYKSLSPAQMVWVLKLTQRAQGFEEPRWRKVPGFEALRSQLVHLKKHIPRGKYEYAAPFGKVVLAALGNKAKHPNTISVTNDGTFGEDQVWYGFIDLGGVLNIQASLPASTLQDLVQVVTTAQEELLCQGIPLESSD